MIFVIENSFSSITNLLAHKESTEYHVIFICLMFSHDK